MKVLAGKVVSGKIVLDDGTLEEGATVTVVVGDGNDTFLLSESEEAEIGEAVEEADRGDFVDGDELLRSLSAPR